MNKIEPHRHIEHNRKPHIVNLCETYVTMFLCGSTNTEFMS